MVPYSNDVGKSKSLSQKTVTKIEKRQIPVKNQ